MNKPTTQPYSLLPQSLELLESVFDTVPLGIVVYSEDGNIRTHVNQSFCDFVGYSRQEVLNETYGILTVDDDLDESLESRRKLRSGEIDRYVLEKRYRHKKGHIVWGEVESLVLRDANGDVLNYISFVHDITEDKENQEALQASEKRFKTLIDNSNQGIMLHRDFKALYANKAFVELYGYDSEQEILDLDSTRELIAPETADPAHHTIFEGDEEESNIEYICVKKDGTRFWVQRRSFVIDWEGQPTVCTARIDISERKKAEEALVEFQEGLDFTSGEVLVNYRYQENPEKPETEKEWGKIELKNLSIKYRERLQAMMDLNGNISYDVESIRLDNIVGRYGDSPLHLEGEIDRKDASALEFSLRLNLPELLQKDLKDIPVFSGFNYSGPAHISMNINGTPKNFKFEQQADLTRTGYEIPSLIKKNENALNQFRAKGRLSEKDGLDIEGWSYELRGNKITGSMQIPDLNIQGFKFELASEDFQALPSLIFSDSWTADGSVNFKISGDGNLNELKDSRFAGKMDLINLKVRPEKISSEWLLNAKLRFNENRYDIRSASIVSANSKVDISGVYQGGDSPNLELILTGEKFDIDELFPDSQEKDTKVIDFLVREDFFQKGEGQILFDVGQLNFKMLHLNKVAGKFSLNDKVLRLTDLNVGDNPLVKSSGEYAIDEKGVSTFEGRVEAKDVKTENVFSLFGNVFEKSLSGDVKKFNARIKGKGKDGAEILKSLSGKISLDIQSGMMDQEKLKHGVHKLFGSGPGSLPLKDSNRSSFKQLSGDFIPKGGIFKTENFIFETDNRRTSIVGTFDLQKNKMDTVVGVAPLAKLDRFLTKIPLFGKILTAGDEKSLLKTYYKVKGNFDDPEISAIPFTSLGKKVMGIFQGFLETPVEILESLPKIESSPVPSKEKSE